ncbi:MAG: hypothetical protein WDM71_11480 [Ferruginibacter sp.]
MHHGTVLTQIETYKTDIAQTNTAIEDAESFRIKYLGTKGIIKSVMGEIKNVPNEKKKEFGQIVNDFKLLAETKYEELKLLKRPTTNQQRSTNSIFLYRQFRCLWAVAIRSVW